MDKLTKACGKNRNIHLTFARMGDINQLFSDKREKKKQKKKQKKKNIKNKNIKNKNKQDDIFSLISND